MEDENKNQPEKNTPEPAVQLPAPTAVGRLRNQLVAMEESHQKAGLNPEASKTVLDAFKAAQAQSWNIGVDVLETLLAAKGVTKQNLSPVREKIVNEITSQVRKLLTTLRKDEDSKAALQEIVGQVKPWMKAFATGKGEEKCPGFDVVLRFSGSSVSVNEVVRIPVPRES